MELQTALSEDHALALASVPLEDVVDFMILTSLTKVLSMITDIFIRILADQW